MVISAWALNVPYQAELCEDYAKTREPATWEDIPIVSDFCLRVQRCAVQATGKVMGTLVLQERARWLNLANLMDREKDDVMDSPVVPEGIFRAALASMQQR